VLESSAEVKGKKKLQRFDVLTHNIGGGAENDPGEKGIAYTYAQIDERKPDVVMLEEVCHSQYASFKARYPTWKVLFAQMRASHPGCANGEPKGQLLASRRAMVEVLREDLGDVDPSGDKHFTLLCGAVPMPDTQRKVLACVTHLRAEGSDAAAAEAARGRQVRRIHQHLNDRIHKGQAVVVAGDFNAGPHRDTLDPLYRLTRNGGFGGGLFDEADQTDARRERLAKEGVRCAAAACRSGEGTMTSNNAKLDFVFFSHNRVGGRLGADALGSGGSGHRLYEAWAELDL
jgi:endonuclease/exonuclease/phosphatase family metal-dependent hydrolase